MMVNLPHPSDGAHRSSGSPARRVLIFLLGSLGDTIVALPSLHLIARRFPEAERRVLTHYAVSEKAASMRSLLDGSGLVHDYFQFEPRSQDMQTIIGLIGAIRRWKPDVLVHLHEPRGRLNALRDMLFFRACGVRDMIGIPLSPDLQHLRRHGPQGRYEQRAEFLHRSLQPLGDPRLHDGRSWSLGLTPAEYATAALSLAPLRSCDGIVAMSIGTKVDVNDWGDPNWASMLGVSSQRLRNHGLVIIGARQEFERSESLRAAWQGASLNLCGQLSPRESAAVLSKADLFVGHDSGPLHLAASVGLRCVGIFSARNVPGHWFPYGDAHAVFYHQTDCHGCRKDQCEEFAKKCIMAHQPAQVAAAVVTMGLEQQGASTTQAPVEKAAG